MLPLIRKQTFEIENFRTFLGPEIRHLRLGWEAYGQLNAEKSNAILITHYFSGSSHAAGKYADSDIEPGFWDAVIGPGKPIDTNRFYVLSMDSLVNLNAYDPHVITTGPASLDPDTGKPYGLGFPVITIRDFVEAQRALLDHLGIGRLHAVAGPSMGGLQAYEWAAVHPERVARLLPVIAGGWTDADLIARLNIWGAPIRLDPDWRDGAYYGRRPPLRGLCEALKLITYDALHEDWANAAFARKWADSARDPAAGLDHAFAIEAALDAVARERAARLDANHLLYLIKANQLFTAGHGGDALAGLRKITAPTLIVYQPQDRIFRAERVRQTAEAIGDGGAPVSLFEINGAQGHLDGLLSIGQAGAAIAAFLA